MEKPNVEIDQNSKQIAAFFEAIPMPLIISRVSDGLILFANQLFADTLQMPVETLTNHHTPNLYHDPHDREMIIQEIKEKGRVENRELLIKRSDGTLRWILLSMRLITYEGDPALLTGFHDVTEHKQTELKLAQERQLLSTLINHLPDLIYVKDTESRFVTANQALARTMGVDRSEDVVGRTDFDFAPKALAAQYFADELAVFRTGQPLINHEEIVEDATGDPRWLLTTKVPLSDPDGKLIGLVGIGHDITERVRAEQALRESEERYRLIVDMAQEGICMIGADATIEFVNRRMADMFGYEMDELSGQSVFVLMEEDQRSAAQQLAVRQVGHTAHFEFQFRKKSGDPLWALVSSSPLFGPDNVYMGTLALIADLTERKRAEEEIRQQAASLTRSNTELEQFAYVASHDLQEPLRMVSSYLQLIERRYKDKLDDDAHEFIGFAVDGANRMKRLINDLLTYSRVGTRGQPFVPTDCEAILAQVLGDLQTSIEEAGAVVTHDPLPTINGDERQLAQLFQNLIGNAVKFRSEEPPVVHLSAIRQDDHWLFSVEDNGIGIDPQYTERIFIIFQRLHGVGTYPGTGIGLAISKKIVERHGGKIWPEPHPPHGTIFYFTIPITEGES